ncbi:MAG: MFS transporter [bacterium]|nr:MFS transporter [bacterium]
MNKQSRKAWLVTICAVMGAVAIAIAQKKMMPCIDIVQSDFSIDKASAGWLSSIFCVTGVFTAVPAAMIVNRLGERKACLISLAFAIVGSALGIASESYGLMLVSRIIEGVGAGLISVAVPGLITLWFPPEKRGLPTGLWTSWQFIAQAFCFLVGTSVSASFGWRGVWVVSLGISVLCLVLNALFVKSPETGGVSRGNAAQWDMKAALQVLDNRNVWFLSVAMFCYCFCYIGQATWLAACWNEQAGMSIDFGNRLISYSSILAIPITLLAGMVLDKVDRKRICVWASMIYVILVAAGFVCRSQAWIVAIILIKPFAEALISTSLWTMIPLAARNTAERSWGIAFFTLLSNLAMLVSAPIVGKMASQLSWLAAGAALAVVAALGAVTAGLYRNDPKC